MRQVNIKALKANLSKELLDLPFEIIRYGQVVGVVSQEGGPELKEKVVTTKKVVTSVKKGGHNQKAAIPPTRADFFKPYSKDMQVGKK